MEECDPATDTWRQKADMPRARGNFSVSEVNGQIYAIGGRIGGGTPISTVEAYDTGFKLVRN